MSAFFVCSKEATEQTKFTVDNDHYDNQKPGEHNEHRAEGGEPDKTDNNTLYNHWIHSK